MGGNFFGKKPLLFTNPKEEQSHDFEGMVKMMQKLSNRIIDLEKENETQKSFKPYYKRRDDNNQHKNPPHSHASLNLNEVGMDIFCTFHQQPHSEKKLSSMDKFDDISYESVIGP